MEIQRRYLKSDLKVIDVSVNSQGTITILYDESFPNGFEAPNDRFTAGISMYQIALNDEASIPTEWDSYTNYFRSLWELFEELFTTGN